MAALTLFGQGAPVSGASSSTQDQVLGVVFQVSSSVPLAAVWFYSPAGASGLPGAVAAYVQSSHALVVSNTSPAWSGAVGSGWVRAPFASPPTLSASTLYAAAVYHDSSFTGTWAQYQTGYWTGTSAANGILSAPNSAGGNTGVLLNSAGGSIAYPSSSFSDTNYNIDVEVTVAAPPAATGLLMVTGF